jgi:UDP-N-acetyl-D-glucosamine dehydrogenase
VNISVVGQGYVGLPVALAICSAGHKVFGIDSNAMVVAGLNEGKSHIEDIKDIEIQKLNEFRNYTATSDFTYISKSEVIVVCLPTPLFESNVPDLSILKNAVIDIAKHLKSGSLVIIESTIQPGTTRKLILPLILNNSDLGIEDFDLAFSPERIDPTNLTWNLQNTPKLVAGLNSKSCSRAVEFYSSFIDKVYECETLEIAETAKLLENSFRLINISFINELTMLCQRLSIDINSVIAAASTKPYGFMAFYPSIGVGGHCIPVDPIYLSHTAKEVEVQTKMIDSAVEINKFMPNYFVFRAEKILGSLDQRKILVIGVAYKPNISDTRESPVEALILGLRAAGALVDWHDDLVKVWNGTNSSDLTEEYDLAILATPHDYLDLAKLGNVPILNTRGSIL